MSAERNDLVSAAEATGLLARFARARETGNAADVWGPIDRLEDALRTVIAREGECAALRAIVAALPTCADCGATATRTCSSVSPSDYCDEHAPAGPWSLDDLPHAAAVRAWRGAR